jgi:hypothetical protein
MCSFIVFKKELPCFEKQGSRALSFMRFDSNIRIRVFRNIQKIILVLASHPISGGYAVVCNGVVRNLYLYT